MSDPDPAFRPLPGHPDTLAPGLRRVLAPNPSPMTFRGTNSYLLGTREIAVIDPGPDDPAHLDALIKAVPESGRITHIFVTHAHLDHSPGARPLSARTGAPVLAFGPAEAGRRPVMQSLAATGLAGGGEGVDRDFAPDICLADGAVTQSADWSITAHWAPGHMSNHMVFDAGVAVFCGDYVMGWSTTLISPPDGDVRAFLETYDRLARAFGSGAQPVYYPGHGAPIETPSERLSAVALHVQRRTEAVYDALAPSPLTIPEVAARVYTDLPAHLLPAAERNVFAHLISLTERGLVTAAPRLSLTARFGQTPPT